MDTMCACLQPYQDFNARIKDYVTHSSNLHYLVCGWHTGPGGLLRKVSYNYYQIREGMYEEDGFHPSLRGAPP